MESRRKKIILAAGGSGGHIFPSVALADQLARSGIKDICFIASKRRLDRSILEKTRYRSYFLSVNPMPFGGNLFKWIRFFIKLTADMVTSIFIILTVRPDAVVGFGGYSSGTITRSAAFLGIPVVLHEQNLVPGRANRMLAKCSDIIAVSFAESTRFFPGSVCGKIVHTGNPIRVDMLGRDREKSALRLEMDPSRLTVLIMGGSQGATFLNVKAAGAAKMLSERYGGVFQFVHLTGANDLESTKNFYDNNNIDCKVFSFLERIENAYAIADIAVSRSGAAAIYELAYYGIPMILVPYPNPKNNQRDNAIYFAEKGAALYMEEPDVGEEKIAGEISRILFDSEKRKSMSDSSLKLARPGAARFLSEEVIKLTEGCDSA